MHLREFVNETEEYPGATLLDGLKRGTFYQYVNSSFLNGIVNYTKPVAGVLLERYDVLDRAKAQALLDLKLRDYNGHPSLDVFKDDVILLCTPGSNSASDGNPSEYYVFWFDCDVSDCSVGRFITADTRHDVIAEFHAWVDSLCDRKKQGVVRRGAYSGWECISDWMPLPVEYLRRGWISF